MLSRSIWRMPLWNSTSDPGLNLCIHQPILSVHSPSFLHVFTESSFVCDHGYILIIRKQREDVDRGSYRSARFFDNWTRGFFVCLCFFFFQESICLPSVPLFWLKILSTAVVGWRLTTTCPLRLLVGRNKMAHQSARKVCIISLICLSRCCRLAV